MLLDTRLATLAQIDERFPAMALQKRYKNRLGDYELADMCPGLNIDTFNELWEKRGENPDIIRNSMATAFIPRLITDMDFVVRNSVSNPYVAGIGVDINIWPYEMSEAECKELAGLMRGLLGSGIKVDVVRIPLEKLTPKRIRTKWSVFAIYRLDDWIKIHHERLLEEAMPSVTCLSSALMYKPLEAGTDYQEFLTEHVVALQEHLGLEWLPANLVSINV